METVVVLGILVTLQIHFIVGENNDEEKRLPLNDLDVVRQISNMQSNVDILTRELKTVKSDLTEQKLKNTEKAKRKRLLLTDPDVAGHISQMENLIQALTSRVNTLESELSAQKQKSTSAGSSYIRWGRSSCTGANSQLVYSGFAAGQRYLHTVSYSSAHYGGPSNMLCLPNNPELSNITTIGDSFIYGTEYETNTLRAGSGNQDVPCAVCKSTNTHISIMIPGRKSCYNGWKIEYNGLIASDYHGYSASSYICVDGNPEFVQGGQKNENGRLLYFTSTKCGALACPPYTDDVAVNCVVCSQ